MGLDSIKIGARIREVREDTFHETRLLFAERCGLSENHLGKLERGELLVSTKALWKICTNAGVKADYLLFGESEKESLSIRGTINRFLDKSSKEELKVYFKFISTIKSFITMEK